jgi:hypothetical protein
MPILMKRLLLTAAAGALLVLGAAGRAQAYPQFQFSSGTNKCSQCHYNPAGGGLITSWGRDESGDTISLGGDGSFLHGAWSPPSWLALGADFRLAGLINDVGGDQSPRTAWFPMQADLYTRVAVGDFSLNLTVGARGETRPADDSITGRFGNVADRFMSREHYLMWRPSATGPYARAGRFFAPYGLRMSEHIFYVRRYTGYEFYNETYTASGGYVGEDWELHVSAFTPAPAGVPDFLKSLGRRESGGAAYGEYRLAGMAAIGGQARVGLNSDVGRYQGGVVGKLWVEKAKLLFLGEGNFIRQVVNDARYGQNQWVSYLGANLFPVRGLIVAAAYERFQEDLSVARTGRNAFVGQINFFPWAHFEVMFLYRHQRVGLGTTDGTPAHLAFLQLHYYL